MAGGDGRWGLIGTGVGLNEPETAPHSQMMGQLIDAP